MNEIKGVEAWGKAIGLLMTFMSMRAAVHAIRQSEGTAPTGEHILILRQIDAKLSRLAPPEEISDLDYDDLL